MKTIELDEALLADAQRLSNAQTEQQAVELAVREFINTLRRKKMLELFGKVEWEGDLAAMRSE